VEELRSRLPELPEERRDRFVRQYELSRYDASLLTASKAMADFFEHCLGLIEEPKLKKMAKAVSNWMSGDFTRLLHATDTEIGDSRVTPEHLVAMLDLIDNGTLSGAAAKAVFEEVFNTGKRAAEIIAERGLTQISDAQEIDGIVSRVIATNTQAVSDFKKGKEQALTFLVGQVMRETKGRANPSLVNKLLKESLKN
jgi:aspartyl-tRNA(Asn)/glutamyl-tRNA(Gln) amidotransferase subunit B